MQQLPRIENIYHLYLPDLLLLFSFLCSLKNQYMNHLVYYLHYDISDTADELNKK